jgi:SRSO17 transposase
MDDPLLGTIKEGLLMAVHEVPLADLREIRGHLDPFLEQFVDCVHTRPSRAHFKTYVSGQTSDLERKSMEPIALEFGVPPRSLQEFMEIHRWDEDALRLRLHQVVRQQHPSLESLAIIDETGMPKKGEKTAGVQRQYCGATGKKDNCVVSVHIGYCTESIAALVDSDLFIPEGWCNDPGRRKAAGIPENLIFREKWKISLDLLDRCQKNGLIFRYLAADEYYGRGREFREGVAQRGIIYVVDVPRDITGWFEFPELKTGPRGGVGLSESSPKALPVESWMKSDTSEWETFLVKETEKGPVVWKVRRTPFWAWKAGLPGNREELLVVQNQLEEGVTKFFLSNAPPECPTETLLGVAFNRAEIEHLFEVAKGEIGFDHFEMRKYRPLQRHFVVSMVSLLFLMQESRRLEKKTLGGARLKSARRWRRNWAPRNQKRLGKLAWKKSERKFNTGRSAGERRRSRIKKRR